MVAIIFISVTVFNMIFMVGAFFAFKEQNESKRAELEKQANNNMHAIEPGNS